MKERDYIKYCNLLDSTIIPSTLSEEESKERLKVFYNWVRQHIPAKLYKFRECNENNINAFRNQQIWFATGSKMNDDYDAILYSENDKILTEVHNLFDENGNLIFLKALKAGDAMYPKLYDIYGTEFVENARKNLSLADDEDIKQFSLNFKLWVEESFKEQFPFITQSVQSVIKFFSFSENIGSPLMWGKYANNSSGFALAYDFRNENYNECPCKKFEVTCFTPKTNVLLPIVYRDKRINATDYARFIMQTTFTKHLLSNLQTPQQLCEKVLATVTCSDTFMQTKIVNSKFKDWDYEKEWRMTVSYNSPFYTTDQTTNTWKKPCALYLGRKIKDTDELVLRNIAYKQDIPVYKMKIDEAAEDYELKPIKQSNTKKDLILK